MSVAQIKISSHISDLKRDLGTACKHVKGLENWFKKYESGQISAISKSSLSSIATINTQYLAQHRMKLLTYKWLLSKESNTENESVGETKKSEITADVDKFFTKVTDFESQIKKLEGIISQLSESKKASRDWSQQISKTLTQGAQAISYNPQTELYYNVPGGIVYAYMSKEQWDAFIAHQQTKLSS